MRSRAYGVLLIIAALLVWLFAPFGWKEQVSYQPLGLPVEITIDSQGELSLSTEGVTDIPTPIGTFGVGVVTDPTVYLDTSKKDIQTTLTVRKNGKDTFYDLNGMKANSINFEPGYYQAISLSWRGNDLLLEMVRLDTPNENPTVGLTNSTTISVSEASDDFSCGATAFTSGMGAVVVQAVNVRTSPEVPQDWYANWDGVALQTGEKVIVIAQPKFTDGYWLKIRRKSGEEGWVKECTPQDGVLVAPE